LGIGDLVAKFRERAVNVGARLDMWVFPQKYCVEKPMWDSTVREFLHAAQQAGFRCILTRDRLFSESATRGAPKRFPEFCVVLVTILQLRGPEFLIRRGAPLFAGFVADRRPLPGGRSRASLPFRPCGRAIGMKLTV
jgi:hypothetical protein